MMIDYTTNDVGIFNEDQLQSRLCVVRQYVSKPIPEQPWSDDFPAVIPFHDNDDDNDNNNNTEGRRGGIIIGSARHAANMSLLKSMNVIAVLNCASGGIARLPVSEMEECGISYSFTNCRQDSHTYPILHDKLQTPARPDKLENLLSGKVDEYDERLICSKHLEASNALFAEIRRRNVVEVAASKDGSRGLFVMFFCVAGQNRSAVLAMATMLIHGMSLETILKHCARQRPFVLENVGFQRQLVELEAIIISLMTNNSDLTICNRFSSHWDLVRGAASLSTYSQNIKSKRTRGNNKNENQFDERKLELSQLPILTGHEKVEIELLIPGLCSMEAQISQESTIPALKKCLVEHVNDNLLCHDKCPSKVAKAWLILAMFGSDDMWDLPLEVEAVELKVQLDRMKLMFGLNTRLKDGEPYVTWSAECRFALVIFSVVKFPTEPSSSLMDTTEYDIDPSMRTDQVPWTFVHEERPNAPATLLENTLKATHLRAWDFVNGKAFASTLPTVFSFADDPRDKRAFMMVSRSAAMLQQFQSPGEGDILGMGNNAIVHKVQLASTRPDGRNRDENWTTINVGLENGKRRSISSSSSEENDEEDWDAAVKRPFSLSKMLAFLQNSSEAGLAKRLRLANLLNSDKRVLYFYGIGLGLSTNAYNQNEYKFELMLLSKYDENFSSYTLRCFMEEYTTQLISVTDESRRMSIERMQIEFSITAVKVLLVSLLNAFRDLTLMGIQSFDFNHLNNVLVSRDYQSVRLIDIDGNSQGSVEYPLLGGRMQRVMLVHKPCLDVDLNILLPRVIEQLILGKGRGKGFVSNTRSELWRAEENKAKDMIGMILMENFYSGIQTEQADVDLKGKVRTHVEKVAEWFYDVLKKKPPWSNWTHDIYDAMRCIDHLPVSSTFEFGADFVVLND